MGWNVRSTTASTTGRGRSVEHLLRSKATPTGMVEITRGLCIMADRAAWFIPRSTTRLVSVTAETMAGSTVIGLPLRPRDVATAHVFGVSSECFETHLKWGGLFEHPALFGTWIRCEGILCKFWLGTGGVKGVSGCLDVDVKKEQVDVLEIYDGVD